MEGNLPLNKAAFAIHAAIHEARPDVIAAAHCHSVHGRAFSALNKPLGTISQDATAFYNDHALSADFGGIPFVALQTVAYFAAVADT